jgi:hypothetical protein
MDESDAVRGWMRVMQWEDGWEWCGERMDESDKVRGLMSRFVVENVIDSSSRKRWCSRRRWKNEWMNVERNDRKKERRNEWKRVKRKEILREEVKR